MLPAAGPGQHGQGVGKRLVGERLVVVDVDEDEVLGVMVDLPSVDGESASPLLADLTDGRLAVDEERPPLGAVERTPTPNVGALPSSSSGMSRGTISNSST